MCSFQPKYTQNVKRYIHAFLMTLPLSNDCFFEIFLQQFCSFNFYDTYTHAYWAQ